MAKTDWTDVMKPFIQPIKSIGLSAPHFHYSRVLPESVFACFGLNTIVTPLKRLAVMSTPPTRSLRTSRRLVLPNDLKHAHMVPPSTAAIRPVNQHLDRADQRWRSWDRMWSTCPSFPPSFLTVVHAVPVPVVQLHMPSPFQLSRHSPEETLTP